MRDARSDGCGEKRRGSQGEILAGGELGAVPHGDKHKAGVSNLRPAGQVQPRMAVNAAQHKIVNLLKTLSDYFVITCRNVFNVWPKTTLLLPVWPGDTKRLDTPAECAYTGG